MKVTPEWAVVSVKQSSVIMKKNYSVISEIATFKQSVHVYYKVTEIASPLPGL